MLELLGDVSATVLGPNRCKSQDYEHLNVPDNMLKIFVGHRSHTTNHQTRFEREKLTKFLDSSFKGFVPNETAKNASVFIVTFKLFEARLSLSD